MLEQGFRSRGKGEKERRGEGEKGRRGEGEKERQMKVEHKAYARERERGTA
jgi:hypothetical protein